MNRLINPKYLFFVFCLTIISYRSDAQFLMDMIDTTTDMGKGMLNMYSRFDRLRLSGYIQPQFQIAQEKGARSYQGGDFSANSQSRFMLRRSRVRIDYLRSTKLNLPSMQFAFQFDATERGVVVRDVWARLFENKYQRFAFTTGIFARPFGYEVNLSSVDRESPERGRMSQILMRSERDLGAMVTFEPRRKGDKLRFIKIDAGFFNGQGLNGNGEFDGFKDFITRLSIKPYVLTKAISVSGGVSWFHGGLLQNTRYRYELKNVLSSQNFILDSSVDKVGKMNPRRYYGLDLQFRFKTKYGFTELRGEYWRGKQTASSTTSETPAVLLNTSDAYYIRDFDGAFFYLLHSDPTRHHQVGLKYDWYDPNRKIAGLEIGSAGQNLNATNIKYTTFSLGYNYYMNENVKLLFWYDFVKNEKTSDPNYSKDISDNILTCRLQYRF